MTVFGIMVWVFMILEWVLVDWDCSFVISYVILIMSGWVLAAQDFVDSGSDLLMLHRP